MPPRERLDNPAARLFDVLNAYTQHFEARKGSGQPGVWAMVFGVRADDPLLPARVAEAAGLIPAVERAISALDDHVASETFTLYVRSWWAAFSPARTGWAQGMTGDPPISKSALLGLGQLASQLSSARVASKRALDDKVVKDLLGDIQALLGDEALGADSIAPELRELVLQRLNDAAWALRHYKVLGSDGLEAALDRLAVALFRSGTSQPGAESWRGNVFAFVTKAYNVIAVPGAVYGSYQAVEAADAILRGITGG